MINELLAPTVRFSGNMHINCSGLAGKGGQHRAPIGVSTRNQTDEQDQQERLADFNAELEQVIKCGAHNDPTTWTFTPDRYRRPGWRTVHCRLCGGFIGYQPPPRIPHYENQNPNDSCRH